MAVLLVLMLAASGVPSPLYRVYQQEFGFSSGVLTTVFGIYSFALLASLLVVGGLSDMRRVCNTAEASQTRNASQSGRTFE